MFARLRHQLEGDDPLTILDIMGYRGFGLDGLLDSGGGVQEESSLNLSANPPAPPTTCFSPLAASSSPSLGGKGTGGEGNNSSTTRREPVGSSFFAPYSTALSVTIAIGKRIIIDCSLVKISLPNSALIGKISVHVEFRKFVQHKSADNFCGYESVELHVPNYL